MRRFDFRRNNGQRFFQLTKVQKVAKKTILSRRPSTVSIMPEGLLSSRDKEQILDLLAFLLAEGSADHAAFKHSH